MIDAGPARCISCDNILTIEDRGYHCRQCRRMGRAPGGVQRTKATPTQAQAFEALRAKWATRAGWEH